MLCHIICLMLCYSTGYVIQQMLYDICYAMLYNMCHVVLYNMCYVMYKCYMTYVI